MTLYERTCEICLKPFTTKYKKVVCCSRVCGHTLGRNRMTPEQKMAVGAAISSGKRGRTHRGTLHSEATKQILSKKAHLRMSNPETNPFLGKKRTDESREKQSRTRSQRFVDGTYKWHTWHESGTIESNKAGVVWFRSSWEKHAVQLLEDNDEVVKFTVEPFAIPYYYRQNLRHYVPDFLIEYVGGRKVIIEIKPECHLDAEINLAKFSAAREYCAAHGLEFQVWTQKELGL
jgi:hypothetical protein